MPRIGRVVAVDVPHHVTQRGNNRQPVFLNDSGRRSYCKLLAEWSRRCGLRVLGYCLMTNHVHLVVVPERPDSLRRTLQRTHSHYAQRFNRRYRPQWASLARPLFLLPFRPRSSGDRIGLCVDLNPVRAHIVGRAGHYPWSSATAHLAGHDPSGLIDMQMWREVPSAMHWGDALELPPSEAGCLRQATLAGLPLGEPEFVEGLEQVFSRPRRSGRAGRRPKNAAVAA